MTDIIGRTIVAFRPMTKEELDREGWDNLGSLHGLAPPALVLDNGTVIYPSQDPEGNGPGVLFGLDEGQTVMFNPPAEPTTIVCTCGCGSHFTSEEQMQRHLDRKNRPNGYDGSYERTDIPCPNCKEDGLRTISGGPVMLVRRLSDLPDPDDPSLVPPPAEGVPGSVPPVGGLYCHACLYEPDLLTGEEFLLDLKNLLEKEGIVVTFEAQMGGGCQGLTFEYGAWFWLFTEHSGMHLGRYLGHGEGDAEELLMVGDDNDTPYVVARSIMEHVERAREADIERL